MIIISLILNFIIIQLNFDHNKLECPPLKRTTKKQNTAYYNIIIHHYLIVQIFKYIPSTFQLIIQIFA